MTRPQDLYADEISRLVRVAWTNPDRYNAAYPDDPIYATRSMPFFIADHGWYVNGVKTDDPYPDIPEDYTVGPPIVPIVQPTLRLFAKPRGRVPVRRHKRQTCQSGRRKGPVLDPGFSTEDFWLSRHECGSSGLGFVG